jgi:hypothetical protein
MKAYKTPRVREGLQKPGRSPHDSPHLPISISSAKGLNAAHGNKGTADRPTLTLEREHHVARALRQMNSLARVQTTTQQLLQNFAGSIVTHDGRVTMTPVVLLHAI